MSSKTLSGVLPVYKPAGMTSKDVSRVIQRRYGKLKIGHVGTLDPDADGVLPVLIGAATKLQDYLLEMPKSYRFTVKMGTATDTLDASGKVTLVKPHDHIHESHIRDALPRFIGPTQQTPPLYSAVKFKGQELYKYARSGQFDSEQWENHKEKSQRQVTIYDLKLLEFRGDSFDMWMSCSKGTYVRTLAVDLCESLGTVAHVTLLQRDSSAGFSLNGCIALNDLTAESSTLETYLISTERISIGLPIWQTSDSVLVQRILAGQRPRIRVELFLEGVSSEDTCRALSQTLWLLRDSEGFNVGVMETFFDINNNHMIFHLKRGL